MPDELFLSLVFPVYNYQKFLKDNVCLAVEEFKKHGFPFEIILVNDGSCDESDQEMNQLAVEYSQIKAINFSKHHGKGYVVKHGMLQAKGKYIFFTDIDLPYGLSPILEGLNLFENSDVDAILGSRDIPEGGGISNYSLKRRITKKVFSLLVNTIFQLGITDTQCGLKGFRKQIAQQIFQRIIVEGFSFDVEVIYLIKKMSFRRTLLPVFLNQSSWSTVSVSRDSMTMLKDLMGILGNILAKKYD